MPECPNYLANISAWKVQNPVQVVSQAAELDAEKIAVQTLAQDRIRFAERYL